MEFSVCICFILIAKLFAKMLEGAYIFFVWMIILGVKLALLPVTLTWKLICTAVGR